MSSIDNFDINDELAEFRSLGGQFIVYIDIDGHMIHKMILDNRYASHMSAYYDVNIGLRNWLGSASRILIKEMKKDNF